MSSRWGWLAGLDLVDGSSGGGLAIAQIPTEAGYQVPFSDRIRHEAGIATGAVGLITTAKQAEEIIRSGQADCVLLACAFLQDPYWPLQAAAELTQPVSWPVQYLRAAPPSSPVREPFMNDDVLDRARR